MARNSKFASSAAASASDAPFVDVKATVVDEPSAQEAFAWGSIPDDLEIPSGKRILLAFVASALLGFGIGYGAYYLIAAAAVAAVAFTGWAFLSYIIWTLGVVLTIYVSWASSRKLATFILTGSASELFGSAKNSVSGWFGNSAPSNA